MSLMLKVVGMSEDMLEVVEASKAFLEGESMI
jgi:hypothetical protein